VTAHEQDRALIAWARTASRRELIAEYVTAEHLWQKVLLARALARRVVHG
jgi:hypothetical protein